MGKLLLTLVLATVFALVVGVSTLEDHYSTVDEAKLEAFTKIGEKYYYINDGLGLTWFGAAHSCRRMDAQLATFESEEEWQALSSHLVSKGYTDKEWFWMAGNNLDNLKDYYWLSNGRPMHYSKWSVGQPDNQFDNEHCAHLWLQGNDFTMNDWTCTQKAHFICEAASPKTVTITIW